MPIQLVQGPDGLAHVPTDIPIGLMKSYEIRQPIPTHFRKATCAEANCEHYMDGWISIVPGDSPQAYYIRKLSGRKFTEEPTGHGLAQFTFEPGQRCFDSDGHRVIIEREPVYVMRDGDWRGNPGRSYTVAVGSWLDDFGENMENLTDLVERG